MNGARSGEASLHRGSEAPGAALAEALLRLKPPTEGACARGPSLLRGVCIDMTTLARAGSIYTPEVT